MQNSGAQDTVGRNPFVAGQNSKNSKLKNIKIMKVRVFSIVFYEKEQVQWCVVTQ